MFKRISSLVMVIVLVMVFGVSASAEIKTGGKKKFQRMDNNLIGVHIDNTDKLVEFYGSPLDLYYNEDNTIISVKTKGYKQNKILSTLFLDKNGNIEVVVEHLFFGIDDEILRRLAAKYPSTTNFDMFMKFAENKPDKKAKDSVMVTSKEDFYKNTVLVYIEEWKNCSFTIMSRGIPDFQESVYIWSKTPETLEKHGLNINTLSTFSGNAESYAKYYK